jgi:hypothetical protein
MTRWLLGTWVGLFSFGMPIGGAAQPQDAEAPVGVTRPGAVRALDPADAVGADLADLPDALLDKLSPDEIVEVLEALERRQAKQLAPDVVQKLSGEQLADVLRANAAQQDDPLNLLVPIFFFACTTTVVGISLFLRARAATQRQMTLRMMVEKGAAIPPELLSPPVAPRNDLRRGILFVAFGLGSAIFLFLVSTEQPGVASLGLIPLLLGLGHLLTWKLESRNAPTAGA